MCLNVIGMEGELAAASKRHVMRRYHYGYGGEACPRHRILKLGNHQVDFVKLLISGKHEQHGQVGSSGEVASLVADDKPFVGFFSHANGRIDALNDFGAHGIHFGVELKANDLVSKINDCSSCIAPDLFACRLQRIQNDKFFHSRNLLVRLGRDVVVCFFAIHNLVERLMSSSKKFVHPGCRLLSGCFHLSHSLLYAKRIPGFKGTKLPAKASAYRLIDPVELVRDLRNTM